MLSPHIVTASVKAERQSPQLNYKWFYFFPVKKKVEYLRYSRFDIRFNTRGLPKWGIFVLS